MSQITMLKAHLKDGTLVTVHPDQLQEFHAQHADQLQVLKPRLRPPTAQELQDLADTLPPTQSPAPQAQP